MSHPRTAEIVEIVRHGILIGKFPPGSTLPSVRTIAGNAGASPVTVVKALKNLAGSGEIVRNDRSRYRVPGKLSVDGETFSEETQTAASPALGRLMDAIERDVIRGAIGPQIPPLKSLESRYHSSSKQVRKALGLLCGNGLLDTAGRGYRVAGFSSALGGSYIGMLVHSGSIDAYRGGASRGPDMIGQAIRLASEAGIRIRMLPYAISSSGQFALSKEDRKWVADGNSPIIGYVIQLGFHRGTEELLQLLSRTNSPVSIVATESGWVTPPELSRNPRVTVYPLGVSPHTGADVARYLMLRGHRCIAYISTHGDTGWSETRLKGVQQAVKKGGDGYEVLSFTVQRHQWSKATPPGLEGVEIPEDHSSLTYFPPSVAQQEEVNRAIREMAMVGQKTFVQRETLAPLFEKALANSRCTAWICADDDNAAMASEYLARKGVAVPGDLSLIAFDNTVQSYSRSITSYDMNVRGVMNAAIRSLISPSASRGGRMTTQYIPGTIVERDSVKSVER